MLVVTVNPFTIDGGVKVKTADFPVLNMRLVCKGLK